MKKITTLLIAILVAGAAPRAFAQAQPGTSGQQPPPPAAQTSPAAQAPPAPSTTAPPLTSIPEEPPPQRGPPPAAAPPPARVQPEAPSASSFLGHAPVGTFSALGHGEAPLVFARGELAVGQMVHGLGQGLMWCSQLRCTNTQTVGAVLLGAAAGGIGSFLATMGGISGGPAEAINDGTGWGFVDGLWTLALISSTGQNTALVLSGTTFAGFGIGTLAGLLLHPTAGQVAMVNSGGYWTLGLAFAFASPFLSGASPQLIAAIGLGSSTLGMLVTGFLGRNVELSRGRMFFIDCGGVVGALLGLSAFYLAGISAGNANLVGPLMGVGAAAGLASVALLTSGIDAPSAPSLALVPMITGKGGMGAMLGATF